MVWMPVSEAAASLGVSERTIWRRIKSQSIETKSECGRTLVGLDPPSGNDPVRELSHVAAAQLSMRKLDADNLCDVLSVLADYRGTFDDQIRRSRRAIRWTITTILVLAFALAGLGWFHFHELARMERTQSAAVADLRTDFERQLGAKATDAARAEALAQARTDEAAHIREIEQDLRVQLAAIESSRNRLQNDTRQHFAAVEKTIAEQSGTIKDRDKRLAELQARADQLSASIQNIDHVRATLRRQNDRVTDAFRIDAARSRGLAEGLRIHADHQKSLIEALQRQLGATDPAGDHASANRNAPGSPAKEDLWASLLEADGGLADAGESMPTLWTWRSLIKTWITTWIAGGHHADELADARFPG